MYACTILKQHCNSTEVHENNIDLQIQKNITVSSDWVITLSATSSPSAEMKTKVSLLHCVVVLILMMPW